jgi:hypothetical protein
MLTRFLIFLTAWFVTIMPAAGSTHPVVWRGVTNVAVGAAEVGPWRQNESRWDYVDDPTVAIDEQGEIAVAWVDQARKDVLFQRLSADGASRGQPVNVSRTPEIFSWLPRIALAPDDRKRVFILWQEIIFSGGSHGGDILFARSEDGGSTFSQPLNLSRSIAGDGKGRINRHIWHNGSLDLAAGPGGALYAAWTEYEGALWLSRSSDGGRRFERPRRVAGSHREPARGPSLALGPGRSVHLAWTVGDDPSADIRVARSTDGGAAFAEPRIVAPSEDYSDAPKIAVGSGGVLHLVYGESTGGPFGPYHVRYTRSTDGGRTFEPPRDISGPGAGFPGLRLDDRGDVYVMWEVFPQVHLSPRGLALTVSRDGGRSFGEPRAVPESADPAGGWNGSRQGLLMSKLAVNRRGDLAIVNSSFAERQRSRVWLIRGSTARLRSCATCYP